ncbi:MAG: 16S rRNA (adenine(1518)-N(6)/adenine(1519)-N(6))-dimethyltransferase RsmA, partial [Gemmatimonadaceae bacterium]
MSGEPRRGHPPILKSLGQHFLTDRAVLARIADALVLAPTETVVEIGPGRGALTELLRERAARVEAVEIDRMLAANLAERFASDAHVRITQADALKVTFGELAGGPYALVGNVPYYITTPLIFRALEPPRPARAVFLVQREVADRMIAPPGSKTYGALSVNVQALARVELLFRVPASAFLPPPKVESAVVRLTPLATPLVPADLEPRFGPFVQELFTMRRKQLRRAIRTVARVDADGATEILERCAIDPEARAETLGPSQFVALLQSVDQQ